MKVYGDEELGSGTLTEGVDIEYSYVRWVYTEKATGNVGVGNIHVFLPGTEEEIPVSDAGWATFVTPYAVEFQAEGQAFVVTSATTTSIKYEPVTEVPAGTPVLVKATEDPVVYFIIAQVTAPEVNLLKASNGNVKGGATIYALANLEHGVGFYNVDESVTIPAGKAYLEIDAETAEAGARPFLAIGGEEATGINAVEQAVKQGVQVFDLQGRRVSQPTKGLYIVNGQKVVVK